MINRSLDQLNKDVETLESKQMTNSSELDMRSCYAL